MSIRFSDNIIGAIEFLVAWEQDGIQHEEWFLGRKVNPVNDVFPRNMRDALEGKRTGESVTMTYEPRLCIPRHKDSLVHTFPMDRLRKKTLLGHPIVPCVGRFYPQGHISRLLHVYPDTITPFRMTALTDTTFTADRNHPLATIPVTITAKIEYLEDRDIGTYGSFSHWREKTCDWGPGMQAKLNGQSPDFYLPGFFEQQITDGSPFTAPQPDGKAADNLETIFDRFLKPEMRILLLDTNTLPSLEGEYDALVCTQFIEYQPQPIELLQQCKQHLKPGAPVLVGFTNHYDEGHAIHGWKELHEFERMGLVLDYLSQAGLDKDAGTISRRNDWRPKDDPLFLATKGVSDPVYVVYGHKR